MVFDRKELFVYNWSAILVCLDAIVSSHKLPWMCLPPPANEPICMFNASQTLYSL